ncbi:Uncharacterised protein [Vibrio cholerae]|uniref:Uncharacterized protein n=1 Tax=Vibrio cholerae TaxID=666 RepID=A0A656APS7_VIBCL|nr:Uncharacterised protein [Vibrio cholerae]CSC31731.1 Uncharacterised protein [Vibrio cholerae]CSC66166.1 Uncharacterised protein [Vibrio cholerae]CSD25656.1 Uncharacterised protein [Vibrio cholerae]CSD34738.1 Uncharacterised protein [Vibrio cholerae]
MFTCELLNVRFLIRWHTSHNQVLVSRHPEIALMHLSNFSNTRFQWLTRKIQYAAIFNKQG